MMFSLTPTVPQSAPPSRQPTTTRTRAADSARALTTRTLKSTRCSSASRGYDGNSALRSAPSRAFTGPSPSLAVCIVAPPTRTLTVASVTGRPSPPASMFTR